MNRFLSISRRRFAGGAGASALGLVAYPESAFPQLTLTGAGGSGGPLGPYLPATTGTQVAAYGARRVVTNYNGPLFKAVRISDNATLDVSPRSGSDYPDYGALDTWAGTSYVGVQTLYDQIGSANLAQATVVNQPHVNSLFANNGLRPISLDSFSPASTSWNPIHFLQTAAAAISVDRINFGVHMVINPRAAYAPRAYVEFNDGAATAYHNLFQSNAGFGSGGPSVVTTPGPKRLKSNLQEVGHYCNASLQCWYVDGAKVTNTPARTTQTMNGVFRLGGALAGAAFPATFDCFSLVLFSSTPTDADMAAMRTWALLAFPFNTTPTNRLIYSGSSLVESWATTLNQTPQTKLGLDSTWDCYNMASGGRSLATEYTNRTSADFFHYDGTKTKNVLVIDAPSNDIAAGSYASSAAAISGADTIYTGTTLALVSAAKAVGFHVVVPTVIARTAWALGSGNFREDARLEYNSQVVAGAVANGYTTSDRAGNANIGATGAQTNTTYFYTDAIHLSDTGDGLMAAIDAAAILAA